MAFIDECISEMVELLHEAKNAEKMEFIDACRVALHATSIAVARKEKPQRFSKSSGLNFQ